MRKCLKEQHMLRIFCLLSSNVKSLVTRKLNLFILRLSSILFKKELIIILFFVFCHKNNIYEKIILEVSLIFYELHAFLSFQIPNFLSR